MKPVFVRRNRRRNTTAKSDGAFFKKESQETFFGGGEHETFFQPAATAAPAQPVQRKCAECEGEEKEAQRQPEKKEEEKKVMKAPDKKEEEKVQKADDKKEEEKKIQKAEDKKEEEKKVMKAPDKKEEEKKVQKAEDKKEEEKKVQKKESQASSSQGKSVSGYIGSLNGKGQSLSPVANRFFSSRMGYDFSNVKVHTDKAAAESAKGINAKAYATGNNIVFNEGRYDMDSQEGKKLMAHELTHIVQQNPSIQRAPVDAGVPIPAGVPTRSTIAQELEAVFFNQGKAAFFARLRTLKPEEQNDTDTQMFILDNLSGDENWLALGLLSWGPESQWTFLTKIDLELRTLPQSRGYTGVSSLLKGTGPSEKRSVFRFYLTKMKSSFSKPDFAKVMADLDIATNIKGATDGEKQWILSDDALMILLQQELPALQFKAVIAELINLSYLPMGNVRDAIIELIYSPEEVDRNTAKGAINGRVSIYYFENLKKPANEAELLKQSKLDPAIYALFNRPDGSAGTIAVQKNAAGFRIPGTNMIAGKQNDSVAEWRKTLVHETNHAVNPDAGTDRVKEYKLEFRAYWVAEFRNESNLDNRAKQIKAHILKDYPHINSDYNSDPKIKAAIDAHMRPDGNVLNN